jgi:hypothetical protein
MTVSADPETVFPLLCPAREYDWLPYWKCSMIYSASGRAELGAIFRTEVPEKDEATWIVTQYEPPVNDRHNGATDFRRNGASEKG